MAPAKSSFKRLLFYLLILICAHASAQSPPLYQPAEMDATLTKFKHALQYAHPALYEFQRSTEFEALFLKLKSQVSKPLPAVEFHNILLQLISSIHDGHTTLFATNNLRKYIYSKAILPFHFLVQHQRIYIIRNMSNATLADGSEVLSINGILSNEIIRRLINYFPSDGVSESSLEYRFGSSYHSFYRVFPLIFGFDSSYQFAVRDYKTKKITSVVVPCISNRDFRTVELARYKNNLHVEGIEETLAQKAFSIDLNEAGKYAYMKINRFFSEDFDEPSNLYADFYQDAFKRIKEKRIECLIIDLRGNGGGIGHNAAGLLRYLYDSPFTPTPELSTLGDDKYYSAITSDSLGLDSYFGLKKVGANKYIVTNKANILELAEYKPVQDLLFKGKIYVLIDGGSLSAAGMAAGLLRQYTEAVFVGQETGGNAGMSEGIRQISIAGENTDVTLSLPLIHSEFSIDAALRKRGVTPDYWIDYSIDDLLIGRDTMLEFVVKKIARAKN